MFIVVANIKEYTMQMQLQFVLVNITRL